MCVILLEQVSRVRYSHSPAGLFGIVLFALRVRLSDLLLPACVHAACLFASPPVCPVCLLHVCLSVFWFLVRQCKQFGWNLVGAPARQQFENLACSMLQRIHQKRKARDPSPLAVIHCCKTGTMRSVAASPSDAWYHMLICLTVRITSSH